MSREDETTWASAYLSYRRGTSDKVYNLELTHETTQYPPRWTVRVAYGRRGSVLIHAEKGTWQERGPAHRCYLDLIREKERKGYQHTTGTPEDTRIAAVHAGVIPAQRRPATRRSAPALPAEPSLEFRPISF